MYLVAVGLNHKTAPVEVREKLTFPDSTLEESLKQLNSLPEVDGSVIVSTCNRTEIYAAVMEPKQGMASIKKFINERVDDEYCELDKYTYVHTLYETVHHLFRVAAGLDSMILGESQILGQVRDAYSKACNFNATNKILNTLFQRAVTVGKRARTETDIDKNAVSISYAAVELAKQLFGTLEGKSILIVGAGEMSELTAKHLVANGVTSVLVSNRSYDKAVEFAEMFGGEAVKFDKLFERMEEADIVITATAARHTIIRVEDMQQVMEKRHGKQVFLIDIAVPRDIDTAVADLEGVNVFDIDHLQHVVDKNLEERKNEAVKVQKIVEEEMEEFLKWLSTQFVVPTISALKQRGDQIKERELMRAMNKLGTLTPKQEKVVQTMAHAIVSALLHDPVVNLKEYAKTGQGHLYTEIAQNLFSLEVEGQRPKTGYKHKNFAKTEAEKCRSIEKILEMEVH